MRFHKSKKIVHLCTCCIILLFSFSHPTSANDWPVWRGPDHDGISKETGWNPIFPEQGPKILWKKNIGTGSSSVSVLKNRLYTMGYENKQDVIYCLDAATGQELWRYAYPCAMYDDQHLGGPASTPQIDDGCVFTVSREGDFVCVDATSGTLLWNKHLEQDFNLKHDRFGFTTSPLIDGNLVIVELGITFAFDKKTGGLAWKTRNYGAAHACPVPLQFQGERCITVFNDFGLVILGAKDGKEKTSYEWTAPLGINAITPIVAEDSIYISSGYNTGAARVKVGNELKPVWQTKNMRNQFSTPVLFEGHLYGFDDAELRCIDFTTGEVKWQQPGMGRGLLMLADRKLIIMGENGQFVICEASPTGFKQLSSADILGGPCRTVPVLANGRIYCRNEKGDLVCIDVSGK